MPPRALTPRALLDLLLGIEGARLSPLESELVMTCALQEMNQEDPSLLGVFLPHPPEAKSNDAWAALGARLVRIRDEVAGAGVGFHTEGWPEEAQSRLSVGVERERWSALATVFERYERLLRSMERRDWVMALDDEVPAVELGHIVLAGASDLFPVARKRILQAAQAGHSVSVLIRAPERLAEGFGELGVLKVDYWLARRLDVPDQAITVAEAPVDQARAVAEAIGGLGGAFDVSEISLALANSSLAPHIEDELASRGVATRYAGGRPAGRTAPYLLLSELAHFADGRSFRALASLARHPDLKCNSYALEALDRFACDHLPARAPRPLHRPAGAALEGHQRHAEERRRRVDEVVQRVDRCAGVLGSGREIDVGQLAEAVRASLNDVYGESSFDQGRREQRGRLMALEELAQAADAFADLPEGLARRLGARAPSELLRLLLRHASERAVPDPENPLAIEMTDWLEVVLDDAPALIIAGMNEGFVPQSITGDPVLPDGLRGALGIAHNDQRMAREVHALTSMSEERAERGTVAVISGRFDASREPLVPSRLLLRGSRPEAVVARTRQLFQEPPGSNSALHPALKGVAPGPGLGRIMPTPGDGYEGTSLGVTSFKKYLECPYRFWLEKVKGLGELDDQALELDAARFGTMVHEVLERFGNEEELRECSDAMKIQRALTSFLDNHVKSEFGSNARRTVAIQAVLARRRLEAFAVHQAERVSQGWRIIDVEHSVNREDLTVPLPGLDGAFFIHGRIDRVDRHEDGRIAVLDYKTSSSKPEADHRRGRKNAKEWFNLQLPLYRHLASTIGTSFSTVETGYVLLPNVSSKAGFFMADWDEDELASADELAAQVASDILAGRFWPPASKPPKFSEALAAICQDGALNAQHLEPTSEASGAGS